MVEGRLHWAWLALGVSVVVFGAPSPAFSQEATDDVIIVTGARTSADTIEGVLLDVGESNIATSALDVLRRAPGVSVVSSGTGSGEIFLRGAESNFAAVLIDGVRVNDNANSRGGGYDFSTIDPSELDRVEIIDGPASAWYGSDSMSGVINLITRAPNETPRVLARVDIGADDRAHGFLSLAQALSPDFAARVNGAYQNLSGAGEAEESLATLSVRTDQRGAASSWQTGARYARRERASYPTGSGAPLASPSQDLEHAEADEALLWARAQSDHVADWRLVFSGSYFSRSENIVSPAIAPSVFDGVPASESDTSLDRFELLGVARRSFGALDFGAGVNLVTEDGERDGTIDFGFPVTSAFSLSRTVPGVFVEARYAPAGRLELSGALRADRAEDDETPVSGRVAASLELADDVVARASWGNGRKAPSLYALGDTIVGNPLLDDESSEVAELSLEARLSNTRVTLSAFQSAYANLIDFDFATFKLVNRAGLDVQGVAFETSTQINETLSIGTHLTFLDLDGDGFTPLNRPERFGGVSLDWRPASRWIIEASTQFVGERDGSSIPTGPATLSSYTRVDVSAAYALNERASLVFAIDNLLDAEAEESAGLPIAPQRWRSGLVYAF